MRVRRDDLCAEVDTDVAAERLTRAPQRPTKRRLSSDDLECWCWFDDGREAVARVGAWIVFGALAGGLGVLAGIALAVAGYGGGWWTR